MQKKKTKKNLSNGSVLLRCCESSLIFYEPMTEDAWNQVFNTASSQTMMDLGISVGKFYKKDSNLNYYEGLTPLHVAAGTDCVRCPILHYF